MQFVSPQKKILVQKTNALHFYDNQLTAMQNQKNTIWVANETTENPPQPIHTQTVHNNIQRFDTYAQINYGRS